MTYIKINEHLMSVQSFETLKDERLSKSDIARFQESCATNQSVIEGCLTFISIPGKIES